MSKTLEDLLNENNLNSQNNSQPSNNSSPDQEPSLTAILANVLTHLTPVLVSKITGQKLPVANTNNDQNALQKLTPILQNMFNTQNLLLQEVILLKKNDQSIANGFQNLKLTREKQQVEYNTNQNSNDYE